MPPADLAHRIHAIRNTAEVIAQSLQEMISEAELPPGQPLIQERIAEMFQVSRVPVRDALQLLIGMGIAVNVPRRGVMVRPLSEKHLDDLFEVRKILEGAAIRMALQKATPGLQRRLQELIRQQAACLRTGDVKGHAKLDDAFHETLYGDIGNLRLRELILSNWEMIKQARCASVVAPKHGMAWIATSINRHKRILAALKRRDEAAAAAVTFENIETSKQETTRSLREMGWLDSSPRPAEPVPPPRRHGKERQN
ncbi:MAG: GntR family transcriptional regulator [candidate division NC10 bacterium]|nr:GntR family transcriptional regulator [candidate division NC10 bacterium]